MGPLPQTSASFILSKDSVKISHVSREVSEKKKKTRREKPWRIIDWFSFFLAARARDNTFENAFLKNFFAYRKKNSELTPTEKYLFFSSSL